MKARLKPGSVVWCDMQTNRWPFWEGVEDAVFDVEVFRNNPERVTLMGPRFGGTPYGNGAIFAFARDLEWVSGEPEPYFLGEAI